MIDTELITKAKKKSGLIEKIDASWREFVERRDSLTPDE